ncbi:hypothetical protein BV394_07365 [Brevirhabdus pacifica]|uniref:histidine kinase n=1 Tax=Brevirhabdus pacifica TaxID=1267768 RepID=A0A1U7DI37_9RHOB|nr:HWE histidine kinase domain-containing protein [Brevirhabdus pacifica]APX89553.1 hypothetical protein BV394_07365 [Brevirhabdus pacifica]OWU76441.1 hypothetical protein ATO5_08930 [Loktanella sp. 22II-4b]PJJ85783.1 PAS domain S-box-containing protein [Brevirhabdus pacifica]
MTGQDDQRGTVGTKGAEAGRNDRRVRILLDHLDQEVGLWQLNVADGTAWRNLRHDQIFGYDEVLPEWTFEIFLEHVVAQDRDKVRTLFQTAVENSQHWSFECKIIRADGDEGWIRAHGEPVRDPESGEQFLLGSVFDISRLRRAEEQTRLLKAELNHRERNLLGMLRAMVQLTAERATGVKAFAKVLGDRLAALGRTHDLFVSRGSFPVPLVQIVRAEMAAMDIRPDRFTIEGDTDFALHSKTAESATLVLHELVTNARQHGAFSTNKGRVRISIESRKEGVARIIWTEVWGPRVARPTEYGFGARILDTALGQDGTVKMDYKPDGLVCTIDLVASRPRPTMDVARTTVMPVEMPDLKGKRVMVLEDEALIALSLEMTLTDEGVVVLGPFSSVDDAKAAMKGEVDAAILDVNLGRDTSLDVAQTLTTRGVPFVFLTGDGDWHRVANTFPDVPVLEKPIREVDVVVSLGRVLKKAAGRK